MRSRQSKWKIVADYGRYYFPWLTQFACIAGILAGGAWSWTGLIVLPALAVLDTLLPDDLEMRAMRNRQLANIPIWLCAVTGPIIYLVAAWKIGQGGASLSDLAGIALSCAWMSVVPLVSATHELYHQRGFFKQFIGTYAQVCYLDASRSIAHRIGHHIDVSTPLDSDTATRGTSLYAFTPKAVVVSTKEVWRIENEALVKRGHGRWNWRHRAFRAAVAQLIFQIVLFSLGGWVAVATALAGMVVARFWIESFNYFQHYGQVRVVGSPIGRRHVWNHFGMLTRPVAFEITNHADHHLDSYIPYYMLRPDASSVRMPSVFICFMAALFPPFWHAKIIKPALKEWDLRFATPEERALARNQNKAAGWPDWFAEGTTHSSPDAALTAAE
ncbi:MAG: alkane 1-monooxygenase [Caulobacterales bacterium]